MLMPPLLGQQRLHSQEPALEVRSREVLLRGNSLDRVAELVGAVDPSPPQHGVQRPNPRFPVGVERGALIIDRYRPEASLPADVMNSAHQPEGSELGRGVPAGA